MNSLYVPRLLRVASTKRNSLARLCIVSKLPRTEEEGQHHYWHDFRPDKRVREFEEIPGPKFFPIIGHEWRYKPYIGKYNRDTIHHTFKMMFDEYGFVVRENIGRSRIIVHIFHNDDMSAVYKSVGKYPCRISNRIVEKYRRERPHQYLSAGLGPSNGEEWLKFRTQFNLVQGEFNSKACKICLEKVADELVEKIINGRDKDGDVDIMPDFYRWTLEGVGVVTLSTPLGCLNPETNKEADKLIEAAHTTNDVIFRTETSAHGWGYQYRRLVPAQDYFSAVVRKYLDKGFQMEDNLLKKISKPDINMKDVNTFVLDLFQAGIHTTAVSAAFALYHLARNPSVQKKLRDALYKASPTKQCKFVEYNLGSVLYLRNVIKEALRMNPPTIGNGRQLSVPVVLGGYIIPEGTMVILHHMTASRLDVHFKEPEVFKPERFEKRAYRETADSAYMPFGFGARGCLGRHLANTQMYLIVAKLVMQYEITYHHGDMDTVNRLHNEPDRPLKLRFKPLFLGPSSEQE